MKYKGSWFLHFLSPVHALQPQFSHLLLVAPHCGLTPKNPKTSPEK